MPTCRPWRNTQPACADETGTFVVSRGRPSSHPRHLSRPGFQHRMQAAIAGLFVYPIKSCRGTAMPSSLVTPRGLAHDREWMLVDAGGRFITQREVPRLALIAPVLDGALKLSAPGM